jgi:CheY-like chemotaxis protein
MTTTSVTPSAPAPRRSRRKGRRVLVVEDDPLLAMELEAALRHAGAADVVVCRGMSDAATALESWTPHAVVLDVHLTDRDDGWALAEMVSLLGARPPRIAFSTGSPESIPDDVRRLGPVFAKPYDTALLAQELMHETPTGLVGRLRDALRPET